MNKESCRTDVAYEPIYIKRNCWPKYIHSFYKGWKTTIKLNSGEEWTWDRVLRYISLLIIHISILFTVWILLQSCVSCV